MLSYSKLVLSSIITLVFATFAPLCFAQINTEYSANKETKKERTTVLARINFEPPENKGKPSSTSAGGSRSSCPNERIETQNSALPLTALLPSNSNQSLTIKPNPAFFVYVPPTSASGIYFQLKNEQDQIIDQDIIPISAPTGKIINLQMSDKTKSLNVGQNYQWSVFLLCKYDALQAKKDINTFQKSYDLMNEPWVVGNITRIDTPQAFDQVSINNLSLDLVQEYAQQGLWFETLATLHTMIKQQPENTQLLDTWQQLLENQGIENQVSQSEI